LPLLSPSKTFSITEIASIKNEFDAIREKPAFEQLDSKQDEIGVSVLDDLRIDLRTVVPRQPSH